jgi:hypothetical protein
MTNKEEFDNNLGHMKMLVENATSGEHPLDKCILKNILPIGDYEELFPGEEGETPKAYLIESVKKKTSGLEFEHKKSGLIPALPTAVHTKSKIVEYELNKDEIEFPGGQTISDIEAGKPGNSHDTTQKIALTVKDSPDVKPISETKPASG